MVEDYELSGEFYHNLDQKNRIIIPTKLRSRLGNPFMFTKGIDKCIYAYPLEDWKKFKEKVSALPDGAGQNRKFKRFFFSGASLAEWDKQGRVLIPQSLVEYGELKEEIVTIGMDTKLEIWSKEKWNEYISEESGDIEAIAEQMALLGI